MPDKALPIAGISLPDAFVARTDLEDAAHDAATSRRLTPDERGRVLESLCALAAEQTAQHPRPERVLRWREPLPESSEVLLARLRRTHRRTHG